MISFTTFQQLALAFPDTTEAPHFEKTSFRIKKKIFATYNAKLNRACLKLPLAEQYVFAKAAPDIIYPVPNKWGLQGWTLVELAKVKKSLLKEVLACAYQEVAPKKKDEKESRKGR